MHTDTGGIARGKKGKRSTKAADGRARQGPGKARRERAAALKEIEARARALAERLEAELQDVELFGPLPEREDCPICLLPMPTLDNKSCYKPCCGKILCNACANSSWAMSERRNITPSCAFCRSDDKICNEARLERFKKRAEANDTGALNALAGMYQTGARSVPGDDVLSMHYALRAAELGHPNAMIMLSVQCVDEPVGILSNFEDGREIFATAAAKKRSVSGYSLLGYLHFERQELDKAANIFSFSARRGDTRSLELLRTRYRQLVSDSELDDIEREYHEFTKVEWSEEREAIEIALKSKNPNSFF